MGKLTPKQDQAIELFSLYKFCLLFGGARSGKSFVTCVYIIARAVRFPGSLHLVCRRYNVDVAASLWAITIPAALEFIGLQRGVHYTTTDKPMELTIVANNSKIICTGIDDKTRLDYVLGQEYVTAYLNECNNIAYITFERIKTRLSQKIPGCINRAIADLNPEGEGHWSNKIFFRGIDPRTLKPLPDPGNWGRLQMNPYDNEENLADNYIQDMLEPLTGDVRERFLNGNYQANNELLVFRSSDNVYYDLSEFYKWAEGRYAQVRIAGGLDVGFQDADAFAIVAYIDGDAAAYVLYEYKAYREELETLAQGIRKGLNMIASEFPWYQNPQMIPIYSDTNTIRYGTEGNKKKNWRILKELYGFNTTQAFKRDKDMHVEFMRSEFNAGNIKVPAMGIFADEITQIVWHKNPVDGTIEHILDDDVYHPDLMFALLYAINYILIYGNSAWAKKVRPIMDKKEPSNQAIESYEASIRERDKQQAELDKVMEALGGDDRFY
jgi:phage terminase large subunit